MTQQSPSLLTSRRSPSSTLFLLSGERTSIPEAEATALARMQDDEARVERIDERLLLATGQLDPEKIAKRVAFSRRVGVYLPGGKLEPNQLQVLRERGYRVAIFDLRSEKNEKKEGEAGSADSLISEIAAAIGGRVCLENPAYEVTIVRGSREGGEDNYFALSRPSLMRQDWSVRRPRRRAFFHPAAIFPKLSRALVNLSRVDAGQLFLDPFCGTGSLLLEAGEIGAVPVGSDIDRKMVRGAWRNMTWFHQSWLGLVRADSSSTPMRKADAIATDIPYGRASSTSGSSTARLMQALLASSSSVLRSGRRLVLMHPQSVPVESGGEFDLEEEHHLYIHRKLTRTISVLRRV